MVEQPRPAPKEFITSLVAYVGTGNKNVYDAMRAFIKSQYSNKGCRNSEVSFRDNMKTKR